MSKTQIPVACVQTRAHDRANFDAAWPNICKQIDAAARAGAKLVVLPEGSVPGYVLGEEPVNERQIAAAARDVAAIAREHACTIVYGSAKIVDGRTFNAAIVVGPMGDELGYAAKQFLWHFDRRWFAPGATLDPIDTPVGKLGVLVCADGRIPTIAATLVDRGAQLLVMPTAWVTSGRDPLALENVQADLLANVRARENGVPFVVANKCGVELESVAYCGKSAIVDATGAFIARASERDEAILTGVVTIGDGSPKSYDAPIAAPSHALEQARVRARIAFGFGEARDVDRFASLAAQADADILLTFGAASDTPREVRAIASIAAGPADARDVVVDAAHVRYARVAAATLRDPRGLALARLGGVDLFVCDAASDEPEWSVRIARTRAAELRAFVLVFDATHDRAFAVDPDGVVVAGTFTGFRLATFAYDRVRSAATTVAPGTDVLDGLRVAESLRAKRTTVSA